MLVWLASDEVTSAGLISWLKFCPQISIKINDQQGRSLGGFEALLFEIYIELNEVDELLDAFINIRF